MQDWTWISCKKNCGSDNNNVITYCYSLHLKSRTSWDHFLSQAGPYTTFSTDPTFYWAVTTMLHVFMLHASWSRRAFGLLSIAIYIPHFHNPQSAQSSRNRFSSYGPVAEKRTRYEKSSSPRFEPGPAAWQASVLTVRLSRSDTVVKIYCLELCAQEAKL